MNAIFNAVKAAVERATGCRIYRYSLPHGMDWYFDLARRFAHTDFKVVFDVGANVGQSAVSFSNKFPQAEIYSFEPVRETYRELAATARHLPRVHTYNVGMGREPGQLAIHVNPNSQLSSVMVRRPEDRHESIAVDTIAGFAETHKVEKIDFLKIDTEGYDLEVLSGAAPLLREQRIHFIFTECEPMPRTKDRTDFRYADFTAITGFLGGFGYQVFGVYEQQLEWDGRNALLFWNALFICEKLIPKGAKLTGLA